MRSILPTVILMLCTAITGCQPDKRVPSVVGTWECRDLSKIEHISHFAKWTIVLGGDGQCVAFLTDARGNQTPHESGRYEIHDGRLSFGSTTDWYRYSIRGRLLTLTLEKSQNEEDIGKVVVFERTQ